MTSISRPRGRALPAPWGHLRAVEIRGTEAISSLYRDEITGVVLEPDVEVDPQDLIGARATLRIATATLDAPIGPCDVG